MRYLRRRMKTYKGEGGLFKERTYARVIFTKEMLAKHPKYMKLSFEHYTQKITLSIIFTQICCNF